ncbi:hypothetical protein ACFV5G_28235 [Streptomyces sp. NPDC059766]|uniref:hypothetical protein n=1 Tax=Streptomyces sp. NPDC059766 TaxID=3346940 RepID=UPI00366847BC
MTPDDDRTRPAHSEAPSTAAAHGTGGIPNPPGPPGTPGRPDAPGRQDTRGGPGAPAEYSATELGSHWIQRPAADTTLLDDATVPTGPAHRTPPDRVDGTVLRFGPGVTHATARRSSGTSPTLPVVGPGPTRTRRDPRRHALPALVLIVAIAFLAWQRSGPDVVPERVSVTTLTSTVGCDGTMDVVGVITTNGRPGTLSYRWVRNDGTRSDVLRETVSSGQDQARVHLRWSFQGTGTYRAAAELRVLSPGGTSGRGPSATTYFTYECA